MADSMAVNRQPLSGTRPQAVTAADVVLDA